MTKLPENEKWMFHMIQEINHYYVVESVYSEMIYIIEELMKKGLIETIEPKIIFTLSFGELGLVGVEYPTDYNEEPYIEEDRNIAGWKCPKECCYNTIVFEKDPEGECCEKALKNFEKMRKKFLVNEKYEEVHRKIVKGHITFNISPEHMFDLHEELKQYSKTIETIRLEGRQLFSYNVSLYVVRKWLEGEVSWMNLVDFDEVARNPPIPWEDLTDEKLIIGKIFNELIDKGDLYSFAEKNGLKWFIKVWNVFEKYLREIENLEFVKNKHYPTKNAIKTLNKKYKHKLEFHPIATTI